MLLHQYSVTALLRDLEAASSAAAATMTEVETAGHAPASWDIAAAATTPAASASAAASPLGPATAARNPRGGLDLLPPALLWGRPGDDAVQPLSLLAVLVVVPAQNDCPGHLQVAGRSKMHRVVAP